MALVTGPAPWIRGGQCDSCSKRPRASIIEEKHPLAPPFRLSSSLDRRLLSPYAFFGRSYPHSSPSNSTHSLGVVLLVVLTCLLRPNLLRSSATYVPLCPPALSHAFDLGIVLWFRVALFHSCVSIYSPSLSSLRRTSPDNSQ